MHKTGWGASSVETDKWWWDDLETSDCQLYLSNLPFFANEPEGLANHIQQLFTTAAVDNIDHNPSLAQPHDEMDISLTSHINHL